MSFISRAIARKAKNTPVEPDEEPVRVARKTTKKRTSKPLSFTLSEGALTRLLTAQDRIPEQHREELAGYVHVSQLSKFCPRRFALQSEDPGLRVANTPRSDDRVVWAIGRAIEKHVRSSLVRAMCYRNIIGVWSCQCGDVSYQGEYSDGMECERCKDACTHYGEVTLVDPVAQIVGHPDMLLLAEGRVVVLEIKSINRNDYDKLTAPLPDHVLQLNSYHKILTDHGEDYPPVSPHGIIMYVSKDYSFKGTPYREFRIQARTGSDGRAVEREWKRVHEATRLAASKKRVLPARAPACDNPNSTCAKNCVAVVPCFSRR